MSKKSVTEYSPISQNELIRPDYLNVITYCGVLKVCKQCNGTGYKLDELYNDRYNECIFCMGTGSE